MGLCISVAYYSAKLVRNRGGSREVRCGLFGWEYSVRVWGGAFKAGGPDGL